MKCQGDVKSSQLPSFWRDLGLLGGYPLTGGAQRTIHPRVNMPRPYTLAQISETHFAIVVVDGAARWYVGHDADDDALFVCADILDDTLLFKSATDADEQRLAWLANDSGPALVGRQILAVERVEPALED